MFLVCSPTAFFRGRHASKITEEEEDEECLKEEEDGLSGTGNTRLLVQPSCKIFLFLFLFIWIVYAAILLTMIIASPRLYLQRLLHSYL